MDRSWYNRAGVERVMGYCSETEYQQFLRQAPVFEQLLVDDGILLFKYWLCVDQEQQEKRFAERHLDPLKGWKLSPVDLKSRSKYSAYTEAREAMLRATHREAAPWTLVDFNDQRLGRLDPGAQPAGPVAGHTGGCAVAGAAEAEGQAASRALRCAEADRGLPGRRIGWVGRVAPCTCSTQRQQRHPRDGGAVWVGRTRRKPVPGGSMAPSMAPTALPTHTAPPLTDPCGCW